MFFTIASSVGFTEYFLALKNTLFKNSTQLLVSKLYLSLGKQHLAYFSFTVVSLKYLVAEGYLNLNNLYSQLNLATV